MKSSIFLYTAGTILAFFSLVNLFMSTSVIFDLFGIREKEGNYVLFVVIANFICGILYMVAAYSFFLNKSRATTILSIATAILLISFIALAFHIFRGGIYEKKTIAAMSFRTLLTIGFTLVVKKYIDKQKQ